jgi:hypothetical protein
MYIELTGTGGASTNLIVPANKKLYFIFNNSTGAVTVKVSGQTGVSVPTGKKMVLVSNGTDIVNGLNYIADFGTNSFSVTNLTASSATITNLIATSGSITNLVSSDASATVLRAGSATLTHLSATSASITNLALTSLVISNLSIASANITTLTGSTQTLSGNLTLNGGTANGVLYLNGSKVATSGTALVFDGTNLGIGTSSPTGKLHVSGNFIRVEQSGANDLYMGRASDLISGSPTGAAIRYDGTALRIGAASTEVAIFSGGNLGIGTSSPVAKLQVSGSAKVGTGAASNSATFMVNNPNATATGIQLFQDSQESWVMGLLASSTALTWANSGAEKMRLDSSGNLGIGTSSPSARLHVASASAEAVIQDSDTAKGSNPTALLSLWGSDARAGYIGYPADSNMYITQVNNNAMLFLTNNTERARISAGGYSKFSNNGTYVSSTGAYHEFHSSDAAQPILYLTATSGSYTGQTIYINNTRAASSAYKFYSANANAVEQFYVRGDGVLYAQNTTIQSLSDGRLKENIRNATEGLDVINALRPIRYDWKTGFGNDRKNQLGFVAQEVEAVFPDAVSEWSKTEGDEEAYKTVGPGALIPVLVKAIQELTARVAQLESK